MGVDAVAPRRVDVAGLPLQAGQGGGEMNDVFTGAAGKFKRHAGGRSMFQ